MKTMIFWIVLIPCQLNILISTLPCLWASKAWSLDILSPINLQG